MRFIRNPSLGLFLALSLLAAASNSRAQTVPEAHVELFDGDRWVRVVRLGEGRLLWAGYPAGYDDFALIEASSSDALPPDVIVERRVAPTVFRVRSARREDGLALALRLQGAVIRGELQSAIPDLHFPHRSDDIDVPPDDPRFPSQWYLERIAIADAWAIEDGEPSTTIVVVDNGCEESHPDLVTSMLPGRDVRDFDDVPDFEDVPGGEHGTACAGIVAASTDNGEGIAGTCPECTVRCVRLLGSGPTPLSADVAAFEFATEVNAAVVSNSWGVRDPVPVPASLRRAIERTMTEGRDGRGAVVVFSAGNDNREIGPSELQAIEGVLNVGASNFFDETTAFTNFGDSLDVVAPTGTFTTDLTGSAGESPSDYTDNFGGTSSSAPVVAGLVGLMISAAPERSGAEIVSMVTSTAEQSFFADPDERGHDEFYGFGVIRPVEALMALAGGEDAGVGDVGLDGSPDGGASDMSSPDAGVGDTGAQPDAADGAEAEGKGGCGCSLHDRSKVPFREVAILTVLLMWRRRSARVNESKTSG